MRKAIRGHQRSSESSEVIESEDAIPQQERLLDTTLDGHVRRENPKGRQTHSDALGGNQRPSGAPSGVPARQAGTSRSPSRSKAERHAPG